MINPYPHKCPKCSSPARKVSGSVLCSRKKCSSKAVRSFGVYPEMGKTQETAIKVLCPECGRRCSITAAWENGQASCDTHRRVPYTYTIGSYYVAWDTKQTVYKFTGSALVKTNYEFGIDG